MASEIKVNTIKDLGGNTIVSSNGSGTITGLPASAISSGTVATARLGSGTASSSTFLAGDSSYKTVSGTTINSNADNRIITGSGTANTLNGETNLSFSGSQLLQGGQTSASTAGYAGTLQVNGVNDNVTIAVNSFKNNDGGGNLVIGKSRNASVGSFTVLQNNDVIGAIRWAGDDGNDYESVAASIDVRIDGTPGSNDMPGRMIFSTTADGAANPTERMRITSEGKIGIGKTSSIRGFDVHSAQANNYMSEFANTSNDRPHGIFIEYTSASVNSDAEKFILCADQSATRFMVNSNGNVQNSNNSYGGISDTRLKENITDAKSQWNDIKKIKFKNFNLINETTTQLGVIAQDLEADGMNGLVSNSAANKHQIAINSEFGTLEDDTDNPNEDGTFPKKIKENLADVKAVKYSVLLLKSAKALQEAMEKIETLEAKVTALENA
mgnify:CR=1 FL=1